jgi:hypothetical protein
VVFCFYGEGQIYLSLRRENKKQQSGLAGLDFLFAGVEFIWITDPGRRR